MGESSLQRYQMPPLWKQLYFPGCGSVCLLSCFFSFFVFFNSPVSRLFSVLFCFLFCRFRDWTRRVDTLSKSKPRGSRWGPTPTTIRPFVYVSSSYLLILVGDCGALATASQPAQLTSEEKSLFYLSLSLFCLTALFLKQRHQTSHYLCVCVPSVWGYYRHWPDRSYGKYHWQIILVKRSKSGRFFDVEQSEWFIFFPFFVRGQGKQFEKGFSRT